MPPLVPCRAPKKTTGTAVPTRLQSSEVAAMKPLPQVDETLLVRTDFSDEAAWQAVCAGIRALDPEMRKALDLYASVDEAMATALAAHGPPLPHFVDDRAYQGATTEQLLKLAGDASPHVLMFIADETTNSQPDHPVLVVDLMVERGRTFRTVPSQVFGIDSNLSIANCDWEDFAELVDDDGVFRGLGG